MDAVRYGNESSDIVLLQPVDSHDLKSVENEIAVIQQNTGKEILLIAFKIEDWNRELSPWESPAVFGKENFGGGANGTLEEVIKYCTDRTKTYYIGGYSLAGLFALWAAYKVDLFRGVAAASPSIWFPGFTDFMRQGKINSGRVYLSLGDKEERARNPVMATVGDCIRLAYSLLTEQDVDCVLEWNEGNHFKDTDLRTARAFSWMIGQ